jgi:hypothetical protein
MAIMAGGKPEALTRHITTITPNIERIAVFFTNCSLRLLRKGPSMLDDLLEGLKHKRHSDHDRYDNRYAVYGHERRGHYNLLLELAQKLLHNKAILAVIILMILIFGALGIWLIVALLPYLGQVITTAGKMLEQQGIKGIMETIMPLLQKIWEGAGK